MRIIRTARWEISPSKSSLDEPRTCPHKPQFLEPPWSKIGAKKLRTKYETVNLI